MNRTNYILLGICVLLLLYILSVFPQAQQGICANYSPGVRPTRPPTLIERLLCNTNQ